MRRLAVIVLLVVAATAKAEKPAWTQGWYAGAGVSVANVFAVEGSSIFKTSERGESTAGFVANGGYRWSKHVGIEFGYVDGGSPEFFNHLVQLDGSNELFTADITQETTAIQASALGILPFGGIWEAHMKVGIAYWDATSDQVITPVNGGGSSVRSIDADGVDFLLGIGIGVAVGDHLHVRLEHQAFRTDNDLLALDFAREARYDHSALEIHWRF